MGITSYAQNFEDVMLWRALGDVPHGFWIDIGASDPTWNSVTRAFSERGWGGINVEPTPTAFAALVAARPDEINLDAVVGAAPGRTIFYECDDHTLSSLDPAAAAANRAAGRQVIEREVEVTTLAELCRRHVKGDIHFLKIDVEGAEAQVLAGMDFAAFRPWILVLESTIPLTQTEAYGEWEPGLLAAGYRFAWFDGLNRFYVAQERWAALGRHFQTPPNVFDQFMQYDAKAAGREAELRAAVEAAGQAAAQAEAQAAIQAAAQAAVQAEAQAATQAAAQAAADAIRQAQQAQAALLAEQAKAEAARQELAELRAQMEPVPAPPERRLLHRAARKLRSFMSVELRHETVALRQETAALRADIRSLGYQIEALRRLVQLRP